MIDFDPTKASEQTDVQMDTCEDNATSDEQQYLGAFCDAVGEGGVPQMHAPKKMDQITLNGIPMATISTSDLYPEVCFLGWFSVEVRYRWDQLRIDCGCSVSL